jgi:hypothetical protein
MHRKKCGRNEKLRNTHFWASEEIDKAATIARGEILACDDLPKLLRGFGPASGDKRRTGRAGPSGSAGMGSGLGWAGFRIGWAGLGGAEVGERERERKRENVRLYQTLIY